MTYLEIVQQATGTMGETVPTTLQGVSGITLALAQGVNRLYHRIEVAREWWWLQERSRIQFKVPYSTGTISATAGSKTITGVGTAWLTNAAAGDWFKITSDSNYYEIQNVDADLTITVSTPVIDTVSAVSYQIARPAYALPEDYSKMVSRPLIPRLNYTLTPFSREEWQIRRWETGQVFRTSQVPQKYTVYGVDNEGNRLFWPWPISSRTQDVELEYIRQLPDLELDTDEPLVPKKYENILVDGTMAWFFQDIADDTRAGIKRQDFDYWLARMLAEQDAHDSGDVRVKMDMSDKVHQISAMVFDSNNEATRWVWEEQS